MANDHTAVTRIAPNSTGNFLDDLGITNGAQTQRRQVVSVGDPDAAALDTIAKVTNAAPGSTDFGIVTRPIVTQGTIPAVTATWDNATGLNTALTLSVAGMGSVYFSNTVTGSITSGTLNFEASDDGGTTWRGILGKRDETNVTTNPGVSVSATAACGWVFGVGGLTHFRIRLNPALVGTGSIVVRAQASAAPREPVISIFSVAALVSVADASLDATTALVGAATPTRVIQIGGVSPTGTLIAPGVKPASTAPATTDPALVVTMSPNSGVATESGVLALIAAQNRVSIGGMFDQLQLLQNTPANGFAPIEIPYFFGAG